MKDLRERCEKLRDDLWIPYQSDSQVGYELGLIEAFAIQIRNWALEEMASYFDMSHPNDVTRAGALIYTKQAAQYIRALKTPALDASESEDK